MRAQIECTVKSQTCVGYLRMNSLMMWQSSLQEVSVLMCRLRLEQKSPKLVGLQWVQRFDLLQLTSSSTNFYRSAGFILSFSIMSLIKTSLSDATSMEIRLASPSLKRYEKEQILVLGGKTVLAILNPLSSGLSMPSMASTSRTWYCLKRWYSRQNSWAVWEWVILRSWLVSWASMRLTARLPWSTLLWKVKLVSTLIPRKTTCWLESTQLVILVSGQVSKSQRMLFGTIFVSTEKVTFLTQKSGSLSLPLKIWFIDCRIQLRIAGLSFPRI